MSDAGMLHERWMDLALREARLALQLGEVPVGAVIVRAGQVIAAAGNRQRTQLDSTAHAELLVIREASRILTTRWLRGCRLYVTLEPCPMCAGAIMFARLDAVFFGAFDTRAGCCGSVYRLSEDPRLGLGTVPAHGGILSAACAQLLEDFFADRRDD